MVGASGVTLAAPTPPGRGCWKCAAAPIFIDFIDFEAKILIFECQFEDSSRSPTSKIESLKSSILANLPARFEGVKVYRRAQDHAWIIEDNLNFGTVEFQAI